MKEERQAVENVLSPAEIIVHLKDLIGNAGKNYYLRIKLCSDLLSDASWIEESFRGDDHRAAAYLEKDFLHDLAGSMSIFDMLNIFRHFPKEADWAKERFNLKALLLKCKPTAKKRSSANRRHITVSEFLAKDESLKKSESLLRRERRKNADLEMMCKTYEKQITQLEKENNRLNGRIEELERLLQKKMFRRPRVA